MIHCHGVDIFKAELEKFLASIFLNDEILNDVLFSQVFNVASFRFFRKRVACSMHKTVVDRIENIFSNIPSKDRLNWIKANSKVLMELISALPPPAEAPKPAPPSSQNEPQVSKSKPVNESQSPVSKQSGVLPDIELPKFSTPDISGLSRASKCV